MFIVVNIGGTGNQLFQYAFAKKLSQHTKRKVVLSSTVTFGKDTLGRIEILSHLNPSLDLTTGWERARINLTYRTHKFLKEKFGYDFARSNNLSIKNEPQLIQDLFGASGNRPGGSNIPASSKWDAASFQELDKMFSQDKVLLVGWWLYADIVNSVKQELLAELSYPKELSAGHKNQISQIQECKEPVAVHLRFDFNPHRISRDYYKEAIRYLKNNRNNPYFFVFADNNQKVVEFLDGILAPENYTIMPNTKYKDALGDYQSLLVMSKCRDLVMSKSSFCWWAAWFNWARGKNPNGTYTMPAVYKENLNFSPKHCSFFSAGTQSQ